MWIRAGWDAGGQEQPTGTSSIIFKFFLLSSPSHSSSFRLPFSTEHNNRRSGTGHDHNAGGTTYRSRLPWEVRGARVHVSLFFVPYSPLLFSRCSYFLIIPFFRKD